MLDTRPLDPYLAEHLVDLDQESLRATLHIFGKPLAFTTHADDYLALMTDGSQHGLIAWTMQPPHIGHIYWGSDEELLEHLFDSGRFTWFGHDKAAEAFLAKAFKTYPVSAA